MSCGGKTVAIEARKQERKRESEKRRADMASGE